MKITVLGAGNAGCLTALHYATHSRKSQISNFEVELIHDPDIPPTDVGVASLLDTPQLLWDACPINWYDNPIDAVPKMGVLYEGWGNKREKSFASPLPFESSAIHFSPNKLQEFILKSGFFKVTEGNVGNCNDIDSDFIFDCRGAPTDWDDYESITNPVNSVLLSEIDERDYKQLWTRAVATPDGWTFVIPLLNSTSFGYLYNDQISTEDDAISNFKEMFNVDSITKMKFKNYVAKSPIIESRIILNGNRLFFIEPLEATSLSAYLQWCRFVWDWVVQKQFSLDEIEKKLAIYIHQIKNFLIWHYQSGSKYDTPFWNYAKKLELDDTDFCGILKSIHKPNFLNQPWKYAQWEPWSFKMWYDGVVI